MGDIPCTEAATQMRPSEASLPDRQPLMQPSASSSLLGSRFNVRQARSRRALLAFALGLVPVFILALGCGDSPTRPKVIPPTSVALPPSSFPVWLTNAQAVGFNHTPLDTVLYNPATGEVTYRWVDSLSGWWVVDQDGSNVRRHFVIKLGYPSLSRDGQTLAFTVNVNRAGIPGGSIP
jgi:hypothetical protein